MTNLPLQGIRIVDLSIVWSGPFCTMFLADWGAEVIRVESCQHFQDTTRGLQARPPEFTAREETNLNFAYANRESGKRPWNRVSLFNYHARNKLSMTVDLKQPQGREILKKLTEVSDVFIENNSPRVIERLNLTYDVVKEWKPDIIMLSLSALGQSGPYKYYRTIGPVLSGFMGLQYLEGYSDIDLADQGFMSVFSDASGGATAAFAILAALRYRNRTGKGQFIDASQLEATLPYLGQEVLDYGMNGRVQERMGNRHPSAIQGCYHCQGDDAWLNITISTDQEWQGFCRALGNPPWTEEERFSDVVSRYRNHDDLDRLIEEWTVQHGSYEAMQILQMEGVPAGAVINEKDAYDDHHIRERGFFQELTQEDCGAHSYPGLAWRMSKTPNRLRLPPVRLGEHNEYVYKQVLGVSDDEYAELERGGHIGTEFVPDIP